MKLTLHKQPSKDHAASMDCLYFSADVAPTLLDLVLAQSKFRPC
jgi:hypothetical protein